MAKRKARGQRRRRRGFASWSVGKKIGAAVGGTLIMLATICVVIVASKLGKIDTQKLDPKKLNISQAAQEEESQSQTGYLNVALFGVDSRDNELGKGTRSDTIMVASLNRATKEVKITSVYRDTLLEMGDGTLNKANAAYSFGGPEEAVAMLNKNLDLNIQHYVTVNFNALIDVIDAVGGVEIDVQEEEVDFITGYATEILNVTGRESDGIYGPGPQTLNGVLATAYARIRGTVGDDFRRTERQRAVLEQIIQKAQASKLSTINKIIDKVFPEISTNFTLTEVFTYAKDAMKYKLAETSAFPKDNTTDSVTGIGSIVIPQTLQSNVTDLHKFLFGTEAYTASDTITRIEGEIEDKCGSGDWSGYDNDDYVENDKHYYDDSDDEDSYSDNSYSSPESSGSSNNASNTDSNGNSSTGNSTDNSSDSGGNTDGSYDDSSDLETGDTQGSGATDGPDDVSNSSQTGQGETGGSEEEEF